MLALCMCVSVCVCVYVYVQDVVGQLSYRLSKVTITTLCRTITMTIRLDASERTPVTTLSTQLTFLRSLRLLEPERVTVTLFRLPLTHDSMAALSGLPEWPGVLSFLDCAWPLPAPEYTQLAQCVPISYTEWHVRCDDAILDSICEGINERRARLGARPVSVYVRAEQIRRRGEHVVLRHSDE